MILRSFELGKIKLNNHKFYLLYGDNEGLKEETIKNLFERDYQNKIHRYEEKEILDDISNFFNSLLTKSFFDNEKLIIISRATDKITKTIEELIEKNPDNINIILISKNLEKKSTLRKFFEKEKTIICVPFYEDNNQTLNSIINLFFRNKKIPISQQLINVLIERSRGDRKNLNNELEKIESFCNNKKNLNLGEIIRLTNLADNYSASQLVDHSLAKNTRKTVTILNENNYSDEDNIIIIRTLLAKLKRLVKIYELVDEKKNIEQAISKCKPAIFWKDKPLIVQQIKFWDKDRLKNLIYKTSEIELLIKKNSNIAKNILMDFIINNSRKTNN
jgi:DNA polymerase-3 subunit delta|tara:strand:- start:670 stop:1665 length:996 start_codon:yes stop_codon:yes gene_type:complete